MKQITAVTKISKTYDSIKLEEILQEASAVYAAAELLAATAEEQRKIRVDRKVALEKLEQTLIENGKVHVRQFVYDCGFYLDGLRNDFWELEVIEEVTTYTEES